MGEPALVAVGRVDLALVLHDGGERQRLAAGAGAEVDDVLARPRIDQQGGELGASSCTSTRPLMNAGSA